MGSVTIPGLSNVDLQTIDAKGGGQIEPRIFEDPKLKYLVGKEYAAKQPNP
jgi:hypothetical protein